MEQELPKGARRAIRRAVQVDCELVSPHHDEPIRYAMRDLSAFGLWIPTADPIRTGEQVVVCFRPGGEWAAGELMVFAEVARVATSRKRLADPSVGMGLEFLDLGHEEAQMLGAWLGRRKQPIPRRRRPIPRRRMRIEPSGRSIPEKVDAVGRRDPVAYRALGSCWR